MNFSDGEGGSFSDFVSDLEGQVRDLMKATNKAPSDAWENWAAFSSAINWKETWIMSLLTFHVLFFLLIILTRKRLGIQSCIFFVITILVGLSERINSFCNVNWEKFSTQNYFDKHGTFAGVFFAAPLLTMCLMMLVNRNQPFSFWIAPQSNCSFEFLRFLTDFKTFFQLNFLGQASSALIVAKRLEIQHSRKKKVLVDKEE